jgi:hypothetical protein
MPSELPADRTPSWWRYRVVVYVVLGLAAVDALLACHRRLWRGYDPEVYRERLVNCRHRGAELLAIGGSPVSEGVDPAWLAGLTWRGRTLPRAYNLGLPGGTIVDTWHAVKHGVRTPPRLLLYGITATDVNADRCEPRGPRTLMDSADLADVIRSGTGDREWYLRQFAQGQASRLWGLYRYRNALRLWAADRLEALWPGACPAAAGEARDGLRASAALQSADGFAPAPWIQDRRLDAFKAAGSLGPHFNYLDHFHLGNALGYLDRLRDWAAARGAELVLLDMPVSADLERLHPTAYAKYRSAVSDWARQQGVTLVSASREAAGLADADFGDLIHLNRGGAPRFGAWLRRELQAAGSAAR